MKKNGMLTVFKKELKDMLRDRKTLVSSIIIPLLIFPIMFGLMGKGMEKSTKQVTENLKIALIDNSNSSLSSFIKSQKNINIIKSDNIKEDVMEGNIYVGLILPDNLEKDLENEKPVEIKIVYDDSSQSSNMAKGVLDSLIDAYSKEVVKARLSKRDIDLSILNPFNITEEVAAKDKGGFGKFMLSLLLPMMLMIYAMTGPMPAATDLGAGEKERGTLEPLLTTQTGRMNLLFGKLMAITVMGLIGTAASLGGLMIGFKAGGDMFGGDMSFVMPINALIIIGIGLLLLTMTFGALELSISIYARSFKEAQTYLSPLTIIGIAAGYGTYMMEAKNVSSAIFNVPLVNMVMVIKELINGIYNPLHIGLTFGWLIIYILISVFVARYMFSREEVIFRT